MMLVQHTSLAIIAWDNDFRVVDWNPAAERIFGYTKSEALGQHAIDLLVPDSARDHVHQVWEKLLLSKDLIHSRYLVHSACFSMPQRSISPSDGAVAGALRSAPYLMASKMVRCTRGTYLPLLATTHSARGTLAHTPDR